MPNVSGKVADGDASMAMLLGGKGANLAEMANLGIPVPPGFTITTDVCKAYEALLVQEYTVHTPEVQNFIADLMLEVMEMYDALTDLMGYAPLVSVRSGAPVSMPGMMDTILNVGLTHDTVNDWADRLSLRAARDSQRRLIQMLGHTAYGVPSDEFEAALTKLKFQKKVIHDADLNADALVELVTIFGGIFKVHTNQYFPQTVEEQLSSAVMAVFDSWMNPRAIEYRRIHNIPAAMGTAVTVQCMVFGNTGMSSGTGVLFSKDPSTGEDVALGEFLPNAQGEDVVAGIRTPLKIKAMCKPHRPPELDDLGWGVVHHELMTLTTTLEGHYSDMMDIEFTVQDKKLWLLQCRIGKRSALAAVKIAKHFCEHGTITESEVLKRVTVAQYKVLRRPTIAANFKQPPHLEGNGASPGVAIGVVVLTADAAVNCKEPCILVTNETNPDDIAGMFKAQGILTRTGGSTSHAAVVARAMDKPCIVGCRGLPIELSYLEGKKVALCGATGRVWIDTEVPVQDATSDPDLAWFKGICMNTLGFVETTSDLSEIGKGPRNIPLSAYWGQPAKLQEILERVAETKAAAFTYMDVTPPKVIGQDHQLLACVGEAPYVDPEWFNMKGYQFMIVDGQALGTGPTVCGGPLMPHTVVNLETNGYIVTEKAKTLADTLNRACEVSNEFITDVIGGSHAWAVIKAALNSAGYAVKTVPMGAPVEYAVYMALSNAKAA